MLYEVIGSATGLNVGDRVTEEQIPPSLGGAKRLLEAKAIREVKPGEPSHSSVGPPPGEVPPPSLTKGRPNSRLAAERMAGNE